MERKNNSVVRGAVAMTVAALLVKVIGVVYKIPLSYMLGEEGMGYFNSAYTVYGFFYIVCASGAPKAITMIIARIDDEQQEATSTTICRKLLYVFSVIGLSMTVLLLLLAHPLSNLIGNNRALYALLYIAPSIFFVTLSGVIRGYLNGLSQLAPIAISQLIEAIGKLALGLTLAHLGRKMLLPLPMIAALAILGITLGSIFSLIYLYCRAFRRKKTSLIKPTKPISIKPIIAQIARIGIPITISAAVAALSGVLDLALVINGLRSGGYTEEAATALYGNYSTLSVPMIGLVSALLLPISSAILPRLASLVNDEETFINSLSGVMRIGIAIASPIMLIYGLYAFEILDILFTTESSAVGAPALSVLSCAALLLPTLNLVNTALEARGKTVRVLISLLCGAMLKAVIGVIFIPRENFGIIGAAAGSVISYFFSLALSCLFLADSKRHMRLGSMCLIVVLAVICYLPTYLLIYCTNALSDSFISMVVAIAISTLCYFAFAAPLFFPEHLKGFRYHYAQKNPAKAK